MGPDERALPLVVIGGSAGAIQPLRRIVGSLPPDLDAAICVVIHMPHDSPSALARMLARSGPLDAAFAEDGGELIAGTIRVAPPGNHLLVRDGHLRLSPSARENGLRPAIDPLFRSAARAREGRVVSVVLSGTLDDGSAGTVAVRRFGGVTIAQDPADAEFGDMPGNAIATGAVTRVLSADRIAAAIVDSLAGMARGAQMDAVGSEPGEEAPASIVTPVPATGPTTGDLRTDPPADDPSGDAVERGLEDDGRDLEGRASPYSCPACGGVLYERAGAAQYLCRVGHRYSPDTLVQSKQETIEDALWTALRTIDEAASLAARVRDRAAARGDRPMELRFEARRVGARARADRIRAVLRGDAIEDEQAIEYEVEHTA